MWLKPWTLASHLAILCAIATLGTWGPACHANQDSADEEAQQSEEAANLKVPRFTLIKPNWGTEFTFTQQAFQKITDTSSTISADKLRELSTQMEYQPKFLQNF